MILRQGTVAIGQRSQEREASFGPLVEVRLSEAGGLTQFGASVEEMPPGSHTSERHWHEEEDEFLLVLSGEVTVVDNDGTHVLGPGDATCWPADVANAHHVWNRSARQSRHLIVGTRLAEEVVHYPDLGRFQTDRDGRWQVTGPGGAALRQGELPDLQRARPDDLAWHRSQRSGKPGLILRKGAAEIDRGTPEQTAAMGAFEGELLSHGSGITQFGAFIETLFPGTRSSDRHWHEREDEFLLMLEGEATLVDNDGPHLLVAGDAACWPFGVANGHHLINRSQSPCRYLIVGWRTPDDVVHYSDIDKVYRRQDGVVQRTRRDGSPL